MGKSAIETKWSVQQIQEAIVRYTRCETMVPNVSFGFFRNIECDLIQVTDSGYLHEFEIKRSWGDFMADFKKRHFHDDIRLYRLTFVLPESFAGDRLKKFCADHYQEFEREFDFLFYTEEGDTCSMAEATFYSISSVRQEYNVEERFRTRTYITDEMLSVIRRNDRAAPYRRRLFLEELVKLYRLGVIRLWHRKTPGEQDMQESMDVKTTKVENANEVLGLLGEGLPCDDHGRSGEQGEGRGESS